MLLPLKGIPHPLVEIITNEDVVTSEAGGTGKARTMVSSFTTRFQGIIQARALRMQIARKGKAHMNTPRNPEGVCHRCGGNGHWARTCRTPKHLVDLYQASLKEKGVKTNFLDQANRWIYLTSVRFIRTIEHNPLGCFRLHY